MNIALEGFGQHKWLSVERARQFYRRALSSEFDLRHIDASFDWFADTETDAVLAFVGNRSWRLEKHPEYPLLFTMHGGAILDHEFLAAHLKHLETTDVLFVNCTSDITILRRFFSDAAPNFCYLPYPIETQHFRPLARESCLEVLPLEEAADHIVGFVGRLLPQRNLHQFLRLFAELKRRLSPRRIVGLVIGSYWVDYPILNYATAQYQPYIGDLLRRLGLERDIIYFPGDLSDEDLTFCYGAMDILIHPTNSIDENYGFVPVEAMACGTPIVGAAYGGLKDTIVSGETGFLMPTWITRSGIRMDLIKGFDDAIRLLLDEELRARMSEAAVRRVRELYNYEACAERLVRAVRESIEARRAGRARAVSPASPRPVPEPAGLLPEIEQPWEYYQNVVADYVSTEAPSPTIGSRLRLAAPLATDQHDGYLPDDPAWPATFHLTPAESSLAERCAEVTTVGEVARTEEDLRLIERLIADGLLLCSS